MPKIIDLNIPPGLETLYSLIFRNQSLNLPTVLTTAAAIKRRSSYSALALLSYFVMWSPLYNGFDVARKSRWTIYWLSLPFGSHSGSHGWPGSGFSGFVYLNAWRLRNGLEMILDPSVLGENIILNGTFDTGIEHWQPYVTWDSVNHRAKIQSEEGLIQYLVPAWAGSTYRIEGDCENTMENTLPLRIVFGWSDRMIENIAANSSRHFSLNYTVTNNDLNEPTLSFQDNRGTPSAPFYLDNIQMRKIT